MERRGDEDAKKIEEKVEVKGVGGRCRRSRSTIEGDKENCENRKRGGNAREREAWLKDWRKGMGRKKKSKGKTKTFLWKEERVGYCEGNKNRARVSLTM